MAQRGLHMSPSVPTQNRINTEHQSFCQPTNPREYESLSRKSLGELSPSKIAPELLEAKITFPKTMCTCVNNRRTNTSQRTKRSHNHALFRPHTCRHIPIASETTIFNRILCKNKYSIINNYTQNAIILSYQHKMLSSLHRMLSSLAAFRGPLS